MHPPEAEADRPRPEIAVLHDWFVGTGPGEVNTPPPPNTPGQAASGTTAPDAKSADDAATATLMSDIDAADLFPGIVVVPEAAPPSDPQQASRDPRDTRAAQDRGVRGMRRAEPRDWGSRHLDSGRGDPGDRRARQRPRSQLTCRWIQVADIESLIACSHRLGADLPGTVLRHPQHRSATIYHPIMDGGPDSGWLLVVCPTVWYTDSDRQVHTGELAMLVGPGVVISMERGDAHVHDDALARLDRVGPRGSATQRVAASLLLGVVWQASRLEYDLGEAVADVERTVFDVESEDPVQVIYDLKREITEARRALTPLAAELPELADTNEFEILVERRMLNRLLSTVERIDTRLDSHDSLLSDMLQVHLSQVSVRQNEDMRQISAWAAILVMPTIVAGIYGMNFQHMPELSWRFGYPLAIALIAGSCWVLYLQFKKAGWL